MNNITQCRPPSKIGCIVQPPRLVVVQCRPPSKIGCIVQPPKHKYLTEMPEPIESMPPQFDLMLFISMLFGAT